MKAPSVEIKKFLEVIVRLFNEEQVLEMIDDAFHRFAIDSRWEAQEYIKENFFTSTNKQSTPFIKQCTCGKRMATVHLCDECFRDAVTQ
jgi:hypothetical protein